MPSAAPVPSNDDEYGLHQHGEKWLEELAPHDPTGQLQHNSTGRDSADARLERNATVRVARHGLRREAVVAATDG
jgi:hypothetical protein